MSIPIIYVFGLVQEVLDISTTKCSGIYHCGKLVLWNDFMDALHETSGKTLRFKVYINKTISSMLLFFSKMFSPYASNRMKDLFLYSWEYEDKGIFLNKKEMKIYLSHTWDWYKGFYLND